MKKKRLRYSELAPPPATPSPESPAAEAPVPAERVPRPRRNSTPVELARALAAARAAETGETSVAPAMRPTPQPPAPMVRVQKTLRERARTRTGHAEMLLFRLGGERFAIELMAVDEVVDLPDIHHVPEMPPAMLGVVTVRGSITPVYSPHHTLGVPLALRDAMLIFRRGGARVGVLIDDVDDTVSMDMAELRDAPVGDGAEGVLLGVIRLAEAFVGIVDADALIAACQTAALQETA
ncbi:MAG: chemotaxis protein CheW [bacterium]